MNVLVGGWCPVNILFTLAVAVLMAVLLKKGGVVAVIGSGLVLVFGGALVEFLWPASTAYLFVWAYLRNSSLAHIGGYVVSLMAL